MSKASTSTAASLALVGTTCCALPALLVTLGMGSAVASMMSAFPFLITLSKYKLYTFALTGAALAYSWFRLNRVESCTIADKGRLSTQRVVLWVASVTLVVSVVVAYILPHLI